MKRLRILRFASLLLLMFACKKNSDSNDYATIYPRSYFPVYPGSYWKYSYKTHNNNQASIHTWTTSDTYLPHHYYLGDGTYSNYVNVPFLNEEPIYGYQKVGCGYAPFTVGCGLYNFLSEDTTFMMISYFGDPRYNPLHIKTILYKKTIDEKNDSVIILRGTYGVMVAPLDSPAVIWTIYKKNVGKVLEYEVDTLRHDTMYKQELIDYFVNFKK
jgi:hypothetical protein